jgi:hypothetical protein
MADKKNEADVISENTRLTTELAAARTAAETASARILTLETSVANITRSRDDASAALATANQTVASRDASLATVTSERDTSRASQADFDGRVAAKVSELGINPKASTLPKPGKAIIPGVTKGGPLVQAGQGAKPSEVNYTELAEQAIAESGRKPVIQVGQPPEA